jgi:transcriptional regulator GlxA family with amidase domain
MASPPAAPAPPDHPLLRQFHVLATASLADPAFDVPRIAQLLGLSERTFYRKFRELTGLTPAAYLRGLRLEHARKLLETKAVKSVEDAALRVGFEDVAYFARVFYRRFGQRARQWLK